SAAEQVPQRFLQDLVRSGYTLVVAGAFTGERGRPLAELLERLRHERPPKRECVRLPPRGDNSPGAASRDPLDAERIVAAWGRGEGLRRGLNHPAGSPMPPAVQRLPPPERAP